MLRKQKPKQKPSKARRQNKMPSKISCFLRTGLTPAIRRRLIEQLHEEHRKQALSLDGASRFAREGPHYKGWEKAKEINELIRKLQDGTVSRKDLTEILKIIG